MDLMEIRRRELLTMHTVLPWIYQEVEYLQSNSNGEYINTGYIGNMGTAIETKFNLINATKFPAIIGSRIGTSGRFFFPAYYEGFDLAIADDHSVGIWNLDKIYTARIVTVPNGTSRMDIYGGNDYHVFVTTTYQVNNNMPLYIFRYNRDGTADSSNAGSLRLYYMKIYNGGITPESMVMNLLPCIRKSDRKPGMYDTITKTFYTNAGTGEFIVPN